MYLYVCMYCIDQPRAPSRRRGAGYRLDPRQDPIHMYVCMYMNIYRYRRSSISQKRCRIPSRPSCRRVLLCMALKVSYISVYLCMYVCVYICSYICVCICTCTYMYKHIHIYIYIYTHTHTHTHTRHNRRACGPCDRGGGEARRHGRHHPRALRLALGQVGVARLDIM